MASTSAFTTALVLNVIIALIVLYLFGLLRPKFKWCYFPRFEEARRQAKGEKWNTPPPPIEPGFFGWLVSAVRASEAEIFDSAGLDALMLIKFFRMGFTYFCFCMLIGIIILIPVNYTASDTGSGFDALSMTNVPSSDHRLWAHFIANVLFSLLAYHFLYRTSAEYITWRHKWLLFHHEHGEMRTLLVHEVPNSSRDEIKFRAFWDRVYPTKVISTVLAQDLRDLQALVDKRKELRAKLAHARAVAEKSEHPPMHRPKLCGPKVESVPFYQQELQELEQKLLQEEHKKVDYLHTGFVSFRDSYTSSFASRVEQSAKPNTWLTRLAPEPRDVYWPNLRFRLHTRMPRVFLVHTAVFWLVFFWVIPVAFVGSLTTLQALSSKVPFLEPVADSSPIIKGFLQGFLPTLVLLIFMAFLPQLLLELSKLAGIEAQSWLTMSVLNYYFYFQVFNVFLVSVISGSIFDSLASLLDDPSAVVDLLGSSLPKVANFFINYIVLQSFSGYPLQLLQLPRLIVGLIFVKLSVTDDERTEAEASPSLNYGAEFPAALLVFMISLAYATISPLIIPFAAIYFGLGAIAHTYNFLYVYVPDFESGGLFWPMVFSRCVAAIIIAQLTLIGLFGIKLAPTQASLSAVMPFMTVLFYYYVSTVFDSKAALLPMELAIEADEDAKRKSKEAKYPEDGPPMYTHPALLATMEDAGVGSGVKVPSEDDRLKSVNAPVALVGSSPVTPLADAAHPRSSRSHSHSRSAGGTGPGSGGGDPPPALDPE